MARETIMGRVVVDAKIENAGDLWAAQQGQIGPGAVRTVEVKDALVDTGATYLCLPAAMIRQLGFTTPRGTKIARTTRGEFESKIYGPVRLTIHGRDCPLDVAEIEDGCPVLIGQLPLEAMDWVVDMSNHRLIGNPAHGGEWMIDMF